VRVRRRLLRPLGGQGRNYLAAIDSQTGLATSWNPGPDDCVNALAASGGTCARRPVRNPRGRARSHCVVPVRAMIFSITPGAGMSDTTVDITDLAGSGFEQGAEVSLKSVMAR